MSTTDQSHTTATFANGRWYDRHCPAEHVDTSGLPARTSKVVDDRQRRPKRVPGVLRQVVYHTQGDPNTGGERIPSIVKSTGGRYSTPPHRRRRRGGKPNPYVKRTGYDWGEDLADFKRRFTRLAQRRPNIGPLPEKLQTQLRRLLHALSPGRTADLVDWMDQTLRREQGRHLARHRQATRKPHNHATRRRAA